MQYYDEQTKKAITVTPETPLPVSISPGADSVGTGQLKDVAVTTPKIADGAVTSDKLADDIKVPLAVKADLADKVAWDDVEGKPSDFPIAEKSVTAEKIADGGVTLEKIAKAVVDMIDEKVKKGGDTLTGPLVFADPTNRSKIILAKHPTGSHNDAPTTFDLSSVYLHLGGVEYNSNSYRLIGFGYRRHEDTSHAAAVIGYQETSSSAEDKGRLLFATRDVTTDTAPTVRMTIESNGQVQLQDGYVPGNDNAVPNKKYVDEFVKHKLATLQPIADPSKATIEDVASAYNTLLAALKG